MGKHNRNSHKKPHHSNASQAQAKKPALTFRQLPWQSVSKKSSYTEDLGKGAMLTFFSGLLGLSDALPVPEALTEKFQRALNTTISTIAGWNVDPNNELCSAPSEDDYLRQCLSYIHDNRAVYAQAVAEITLKTNAASNTTEGKFNCAVDALIENFPALLNTMSPLPKSNTTACYGTAELCSGLNAGFMVFTDFSVDECAEFTRKFDAMLLRCYCEPTDDREDSTSMIAGIVMGSLVLSMVACIALIFRHEIGEKLSQACGRSNYNRLN